MKKSFTIWLIIVLGVSLLFPTETVLAATKTSSDFADLKEVDAQLKAKIDSLLSKGVFDGVADDKFGIDDNMTRAQMAKVAALIYNIPVDNSVKTSSFSDVKSDDAANGWAIPYIEAAKKAGLIDGMGGGKFDPSGDVTLGQLATVLVKGLGNKVDVSGTPWYSDALKQAVDNKLIPAGADGKSTATRADLVVGAYTAQEQYEQIKNSTEPTPSPSPAPSPSPSPTQTPSDTTAPFLTAATINGNAVSIVNGSTGSITIASNAYLTTGTITTSENATFTVTSVQGVDLSNYSSLQFTQQITGGVSTSLNLISLLGSLDTQQDGLSVSYLQSLDSSNTNEMVVSGTLTDAAGNSRQVSLTLTWSL